MSLKWGFTFSQKYCRELGLDPHQVLTRLLETFLFRSIRLCAYWDEIEKEPHHFDFSELSEFVALAGSAGLEVTLAVGRKVPRWPEYHEPEWAKSCGESFLNERALYFIERVVRAFKPESAITRWQVENEPLFSFGNSAYPVSETYLQTAVTLVRQIDSRPVLITDSLEHGNLTKTAKLADELGVNIYPRVYDSLLNIYRNQRLQAHELKARLNEVKVPVMIAELQLEPWGPGFVSGLSKNETEKSINLELARQNVSLAKQSGLAEAWLWGAEWWVWLAEQGDGSFLETLPGLL